MSYTVNIYLFLFLPAALLAYQAVPKQKRWVVLLGFSYLFFFMISKTLIVFLIGTTIMTHYIGVWLSCLKQQCRQELDQTEKMSENRVRESEQIDKRELKKAIKNKYKKRERAVLIIGILLLLSVLVYLKYYNFFAENVNLLVKASGGEAVLTAKKLLLPIGISFYTLQAIGYMADVYWEKIRPEMHLGKMALFLSFFPQIMEGPICRYSDTAEALWKGGNLTGSNIAAGYLRIFWGLFKKIVIADRLYVLVTAIYDHYENYSGMMIAVAAVAYTVQLYMEFSGCMDIVIGSGRAFGIILPENFRQPFAARNAADFWRRWHITLGIWLKTYVFYPVSVSQAVKRWNSFSRKRLGKYAAKLGTTALALFPVWLINGLWHGARWSYIFYGMYYFVILLAGAALEPVREKVIKTFHADENAWYWRMPQTLKTWGIIFAGELFFRANGLRAGIKMFLSMFQNFHFQTLWDGTILNQGIDMADILVICAGCVIVGIVGVLKERNIHVGERIGKAKLPVRWLVYYSLIFAVLIFGAYGAGYQQVDLIYAGF